MSRRTNGLKENYEKLLLVAVLLLLLGSASFLVLQVKQKGGEPLVQKPVVGEFAQAQKIATTELEQQLLAVSQPKQMAVQRGIMGDTLRVSCISVPCGKPIPYAALTCPFCGAKQPEILDPLTVSTRRDGIPDVWKKKHGFDILDTNVAGADQDGDGFTTLEEYRSGTDPQDPASHPDIASKLRVAEVRRHPFKLRFMGMIQLPSGNSFQINLRSGKSVFAKVGEEAEGYRVMAYEPRAPEGEVLLLEKGPEKIRLVKGRDVQQFEMVADLISLLDHRRLNKKVKDDVVKVRDREYKIIDIKSDAVTMRDLRSAREVVVPSMTAAEREEVLRGATLKSSDRAPARSVAPAGMPAAVGVEMQDIGLQQ
jgi:hypothetical protein